MLFSIMAAVTPVLLLADEQRLSVLACDVIQASARISSKHVAVTLSKSSLLTQVVMTD